MIAICTVAVVATSSYSMDKEKTKAKKAARKSKVENAQSFKNSSMNGNYKHQFPVSDNNNFKDSFNKPAQESIDRNYKHQGAITVVDPNAANNTTNVKTTKTTKKKVSSSYKHQYGL